MDFKRTIKILTKTLCSLLLLLSVGCSRNTEESTNLSIALPSFQKGSSIMTAGTGIGFLAITVSGAGMPPYVYTWDAHSACPTCNESSSPSAPTTFTLTVPSGNKLIQVMALTNGGGGGTFYYGDQYKSLNAGSDSVTISVANLGTTGMEGYIGGRYVRADGSFPTGQMRLLIHPVVNGVERPAMALWKTNIVAGWFNALFFGAGKFSFAMDPTSAFPTGEKIFDHVGLGDILASTATQQEKAAIQIPTFYQNYGDGSSTLSVRPEGRHILGFFGPGVGTLGTTKACWPGAGFAPYTYADPNGISFVHFDGTPPPPSNQSGPLLGSGLSDGSCTPANSYVTDLFYRPFYLSSGEYKPFGIKAPFRFLTEKGPGSFVEREESPGYYSTPSSTYTKLTWALLPGTSSFVDGVTVFMKVGDLEDHGGGPFGLECDSLTYQGFHEIGDVTGSSTTTIDSSSNLPSGFSPYALAYSSFVLCAYEDGAGPGGSRLYRGAVVSKPNLDGGGSSSTPPTYLFTVVPNVRDDYMIAALSCNTYRLITMNNQGVPVNPPSITVYIDKYKISTGSSNLDQYNSGDGSCGGGLANNGGEISGVNTSIRTFDMKRSGANDGVFSVSAKENSVSGGPRKNTIFIYASVGAPNATCSEIGIKTEMTSSLIRGSCYPVYVYRNNSAGPAVSNASDAPTLTFSTGYQWFHDMSCENSVVTPNSAFSANEFYKMYYVRVLADSGANSIDVTPAGGCANTAGSYAAPNRSETPSQLTFPSADTGAPACSMYEIRIANMTGEAVRLNKTQTISVDATAATRDLKIYEDGADCTANNGNYTALITTGGGTQSFTLETDYYQSSKTLYMRAATAGANSAYTIDAQITALGINGGGSPDDTGDVQP